MLRSRGKLHSSQPLRREEGQVDRNVTLDDQLVASEKIKIKIEKSET